MSSSMRSRNFLPLSISCFRSATSSLYTHHASHMGLRVFDNNGANKNKTSRPRPPGAQPGICYGGQNRGSGEVPQRDPGAEPRGLRSGGEAPRSRRQMLISSYDGGHAPMSPVPWLRHWIPHSSRPKPQSSRPRPHNSRPRTRTRTRTRDLIETKTDDSRPWQYRHNIDAQAAVVFVSRILAFFSGLTSKFRVARDRYLN